MDENQEQKPNLTLVFSQDLTPDTIYGMLFNVLADEVETIQNRAAYHYMAALKYGVSPQNMGADFALETLGLAERANVSTIDGSPVFNYVQTPDEAGIDWCDCDDDPAPVS